MKNPIATALRASLAAVGLFTTGCITRIDPHGEPPPERVIQVGDPAAPGDPPPPGDPGPPGPTDPGPPDPGPTDPGPTDPGPTDPSDPPPPVDPPPPTDPPPPVDPPPPTDPPTDPPPPVDPPPPTDPPLTPTDAATHASVLRANAALTRANALAALARAVTQDGAIDLSVAGAATSVQAVAQARGCTSTVETTPADAQYPGESVTFSTPCSLAPGVDFMGVLDLETGIPVVWIHGTTTDAASLNGAPIAGDFTPEVFSSPDVVDNYGQPLRVLRLEAELAVPGADAFFEVARLYIQLTAQRFEVTRIAWMDWARLQGCTVDAISGDLGLPEEDTCAASSGTLGYSTTSIDEAAATLLGDMLPVDTDPPVGTTAPDVFLTQLCADFATVAFDTSPSVYVAFDADTATSGAILVDATADAATEDVHTDTWSGCPSL